MKDELDLADYWKIIKKRKKLIFWLTLSLVVVTLIISLILPKTYESESVIQLGRLDNIFIFQPEEAKSIIQSSIVLNPVMIKFFIEEKKPSLRSFREDSFEVEILKEEINYYQTLITPYLYLRVKSDDALKSKEMNEEIIKQFFSYVKPKYEELLNFTLKELSRTEQDMRQLKYDIAELEREIKALSDTQLENEGISKSTLLKTLLVDYRGSLDREEDKKLSIEERLNGKIDFKVIIEPQLPLRYSKPNIKLNLAIALVLGLFVSCFLSFFLEAQDKK